MKKNIVLISCILISSWIKGQNEISIITKYQYDGKVAKIRWSFSDYANWKSAAKNGLNLTLNELDSNLAIVDRSVIAENLKPLTLNELKAAFGEKNQYAAIAAQMLYGKSSVNNNQDFGSYIRLKKMEQDQQFTGVNFAVSMDYKLAVSIALGTTISLPKNKVYALQITYKNAENEMDSAFLLINTYQNSNTQKTPEINISSQEHSVKVNWNVNENDFVAYYLEKAEKNVTKFDKVNTQPLLYLENSYTVKNELNIVDSLPENYVPYQYRLVALDYFGNEIRTSEIKIGQGVDKTPPPMVKNIKLKIIPSQKIIINWIEYKGSNDLVGFNVLKSNDALGPFIQINDQLLNKNVRTFEDLKPYSPETNFYVIEAIDTAQNNNNSLPIAGIFIDTIAPACPQIISSNTMKDQTITLTWKKPLDTDIYGYRVFYANQEDHVFTSRNGAILYDTNYVDTLSLRTLSKYAYYKILALDYSFNESKSCPVFKVIKKDTIAPIAVSQFKIIKQDSNLMLKWLPSFSDDADKIRIEKKAIGTDNWIKIYEGNNGIDSLFYDKNIEQNSNYEYRIIVNDQSGNSAISDKLTYKSITIKSIEPINDLTLKQNDSNYLLAWDKQLLKNQSVLIYLINESDQSLILIGKSNNNQFVLPKLYSKPNNSFCVIVLENNKKSQKSNIVKIN